MQKSPSTSIHLFENINGKMQDSDASSYTTETTFESEFTHSSVNSSESSNHTAIEILGLEILSDHSHFSNSDENSSMVSFLEVDSLKLTRKACLIHLPKPRPNHSFRNQTRVRTKLLKRELSSEMLNSKI